MTITCTRKLEFDAGHRVKGHEGKCKHPHGHRYVVEVEACASQLDEIGRVVDFGAIKQVCGEWLDNEFDRRFIVFVEDTEMIAALEAVPDSNHRVVPFNPTAENLAEFFLVSFRGLMHVRGAGIEIVSVTVWETPNCKAKATRETLEQVQNGGCPIDPR
jgi:6-pyruvoyltetrahydropterin/6-carboxytetrahydropterin synthase